LLKKDPNERLGLDDALSQVEKLYDFTRGLVPQIE
jgi:hypothetical protein